MPDTDPAHDQGDTVEAGAPAWTADNLANALEHIRVAAVLHYAGGAFNPEHMRAIADLATEALAGAGIPTKQPCACIVENRPCDCWFDDEVVPDVVKLRPSDLEVARAATGRLINRDASVELEDEVALDGHGEPIHSGGCYLMPDDWCTCGAMVRRHDAQGDADEHGGDGS